MTPQRLDDLLQRYIDLRLTGAERDELENELLASPEARRVFWAHLQFEGALQETVDAQQHGQWVANAEKGAVADERLTQRQIVQARRLAWWLGVAASIALVVGITLFLRPVSKPENTSEGVAILTGTVEVNWAEGQGSLEPGAILPRGPLRIRSGLVGLEFYGGARVTLQGPADVDLSHVDQVFCRQGKLRVQVSDRARGFRVSSPKLDLVDLGSEFGVGIGPDGQTELHVFTGTVKIAQVRGADAVDVAHELETGQGLRIDDRGVSRIAAQAGLFAGQMELNARIVEQTRTRYLAWREASAALRRDPRLVLYYDFDPANRMDRILTNRSAAPGESLDGTVVGATWTEGRWPGKTALDFREPGDRVRIYVPGNFDALTLVAWLRVDSFDTKFSGIMLTDGFVPGAIHWQFYGGRLRLGLTADRNARGRIGTEYDVEAIEPAALLGRWRQVAVVIDTAKREVVHYLDGRPVKRATMLKPHVLSPGKAELGNWGLPDDSGSPPIRNFNGRMDEFMLFNQALSDAEIAVLFDQGRPWPGAVAGLSP